MTGPDHETKEARGEQAAQVAEGLAGRHRLSAGGRRYAQAYARFRLELREEPARPRWPQGQIEMVEAWVEAELGVEARPTRIPHAYAAPDGGQVGQVNAATPCARCGKPAAAVIHIA